ncbi:MAG TPA: LemA family protein [Thermoanaerobaculia bacterium]|nr:LemA family protein [Thermoanaerobaculia bacterium]
MKGKTGCLIAVVVALVIAGFYLVGLYNGLVGAEQQVEQSWAQVENAYQRRADLVPNLVATVKGSAAFERETLQQVVEARSRVGQVSAGATAEILDDPQRFAQFQAAQDQLSSALSRLLVVVERYPELRSVANFSNLMAQLEGTENRIAVERRRYNEAAQAYNTRVLRLPARLFAGILGFEKKAYFTAVPGAETAPRVNF